MKFSKGDGIFTAGIIAGIAVLSGLLYLHNRERTTGSGKSIGKVFFKREIAMRKFSDRMVWEDVENGSALYSHDAVMTGSLSDAELVLDSGLKLRLEANTLVELDLEAEGLNLRLSGGGIKTAGVQNTQTTVTTQSGQAINVTDASTSIRSQGNQVAVEVKEGKVQVTAKDGSKQTVVKDEVLAGGKKSRVALQVASPAEDAVILTAFDSARVAFACSPAAKHAEISRTGDFSAIQKITLVNGNAAGAVKSGDWFLRCSAADGVLSSIRRFRVVTAGQYKIYRPEKADVQFEDKSVLRLEFKPPQSVSSTLVEIADNAQFAKPVFSETSSRSFLQIPLPKAGRYYYRLTAVGDSGKADLQLTPLTGSVNLVQAASRAPLAFVTVTPPVFLLSQIEAGKALISFEGSGKHRVEIINRANGAPVFSGETPPGIFSVPKNLTGGKYEVRLTSVSGEKAQLPFEVRDKIKVEIIAPTNGTVLYLTPGEKTTTLPVSWRGSGDVALYQVILAEDAAMKSIVKKLSVEGSEFRFSGLTARKYYFKVLALENNIPRAESAVTSIAVEDKLPQVAELYPRPDQKIDITKTAGIPLKWHSVAGANSYEVKIFQKRKGSLVLVDSRTTRHNSLTVADFKKLREGDVVWEVRAQQTDKSGRVVQKSEPARSHVNLSFGATPPAPEIVPIVEE